MEYKQEMQQQRDELKALNDQKKNEYLIAQRMKPRHRVGKQPMVRSQKPVKKKNTEKKEIDPEKLAFMMYLGVLDDETTVGGAGAANQK